MKFRSPKCEFCGAVGERIRQIEAASAEIYAKNSNGILVKARHSMTTFWRL